jgi:hypothetical protein
MQYGMMEIVESASGRRLRGLSDDVVAPRGRLTPPGITPEGTTTMLPGAEIVVHARAQVYSETDDAWFSLLYDTPARLAVAGRYVADGDWIDEGGVARTLQATLGDWVVTWLDMAEMANATLPGTRVAAAGDMDHLGAATIFHKPEPPQAGSNVVSEQEADGLSTGAKVAIGVGLAAAAVVVVLLVKG